MSYVLIVEDEPWQRDHVASVLSRRNITVQTSGHAHEALELIDKAVPDVILLDMKLPGVNAMALLHELQSHDDLANIPVVIMSAQSDITHEELKPYGVVGLLDKAIMKPEDIAAAVRKAIL
jgi:CheY-like chemotaxis protein